MKIFFSGIAGSGISAIACFMRERGHIVSGSDRAFDLSPGHPLRQRFLESGICIFPQDGSGLDESFDLAVFSTAVEPDRPEHMKAKALGIPVRTRPQFLAELAGRFRAIAIAGTSGKSTASGLLAYLMRGVGLGPNFIGGGRVKKFQCRANPGNFLAGPSDWLVMEACESDGSIVDYRPSSSVILNLALDHHSVEITGGMFLRLAENTAGKVVINGDDPNLAALGLGGAVTFGIGKGACIRAEDVTSGPFSSDFSVAGVRMRLSMPGVHNIYNALSAIAVLLGMGVPLDEISALLPGFDGIERRFDVHLSGERLVVDDYAHNPHKIASLMQAASRIKESICYIFQPHGFAPARMMKNEYIDVFSSLLRPSDHLILLPIFYAGGTVAKDISSDDLAAGVRLRGKSAESVNGRGEILARLGERENYVVMGARDDSLSAFAAEIAERLKDC